MLNAINLITGESGQVEDSFVTAADIDQVSFVTAADGNTVPTVWIKKEIELI